MAEARSMRPRKPKQRLIVGAWRSNARSSSTLSGPVQTFASANEIVTEMRRDPPYRIVVVSRARRSGLHLVGTAAGDAAAGRAIGTARIDTLIIPGGPGVHEALKDKRQRRLGAPSVRDARRVASVCTGAFLLAETGLLDGRRATTHWKSCGRLQQRYPDIHVEHDPIYVNDGKIWTFGRRHRRHRSCAGAGRSRPRPQHRDAGGAPARRLPQSARRPVAVLRTA